MALPSFFRIPEHRVFNYQPVFYDPKKEEREQREAQIRKELGMADDDPRGYAVRIKGSFKRRIEQRRAADKSRNIRLTLILIFLVFLAYYIFYY